MDAVAWGLGEVLLKSEVDFRSCDRRMPESILNLFERSTTGECELGECPSHVVRRDPNSCSITVRPDYFVNGLRRHRVAIHYARFADGSEYPAGGEPGTE